MKSLISIIYLLAIVFVFAQAYSMDTSHLIQSDSINLKIEKTIEANTQKIEEVKNIKASNQEEIKNIYKIDEQRKNVMTSISNKIKKLLKRPKQDIVKTIPSPTEEKGKFIELYKIALDSVCIQESRESLISKKKCSKWEYFKTLPEKEGDKLILKIQP